MRIVGTIEFARRNIVLDQRPFDPASFAHLIDPAETMDREHGATVLLMMPPQDGKTLLAQLFVARNAAVWPVRTLWYMPKMEESKGFSDEKIAGLLNSIPQVTRHLPTVIDEQGGKTLMRYIDAPLTLLGANILSHRNSRSGQVLIMDESWQYEQGAISEINRRSEAPAYKWDRRIVHTMTGPTEGTEAAQLWQDCTQHTWHSVCPACKTPQIIARRRKGEAHGITWDANEQTMKGAGQWKPEAAASTTRWICPGCQAETKWTEGVQKWMNDPKNGAGYRQMNLEPSKKLYGYRRTSWVRNSWNDLVAEWLRAVNMKMVSMGEIEDFVRKNDVLPWELRLEQRPVDIDYPLGDYVMGEPWEHEGKRGDGKPMRFLTVDVHEGYFWAVVRQWSNVEGHYGESRLLAFERPVMPSDIEDLRQKWDIVPGLVWLDSGWDTFAVAKICQRYGYMMFDAVGKHGKESQIDWVHPDGFRRIYSEWRLYDGMSRGQRVRNYQIRFSSRGAKDLLKSLRDNRDENGNPTWTIPKNTPHAAKRADDYRAQAWAHAQVEVPTPKGGKRVEWRNIYDEDHAADLEVAQAVIALIGGLVGPPTEQSVDEVKS